MRKPPQAIVLHKFVFDDEELMTRAKRIIAKAKAAIERRQGASDEASAK